MLVQIENSTSKRVIMQTAPFGRVEVRFHVFDLLEVKRHVRSKNDVDSNTAELSVDKSHDEKIK